MSGNVFSRVAGLNPGRSVFDLSHEVKLTCDMGQLIPILCEEVVPGDKWNIAHDIVIRFQPLVAPVLHEINCITRSFFVPYRLLWDAWETFISGGVDGNDATSIPRWSPTPSTGNAIGTLWDYLGFPTGIVPAGALPIDMPRRAYNLIYNEFFRDETLQTEVALTNELVLNKAWDKDYFTSSLPWQQRGTAPSLPISGMTSAVWADSKFVNSAGTVPVGGSSVGGDNRLLTGSEVSRVNVKNAFNANVVDLSSATTFDVADLRLVFQIQKWMERNARAGVRYTEFLRSHFGVSPRDDRLQRPEYIGGTKTPVIISEVLQTSSTDATSPQGNMAGHGITVDRQFSGKYFANEYGLIMTLMVVYPRTAYQQGINRQWLRRTRYDFFFPEFANLSEQAIETAEIIASGVAADNIEIFGYQGRYDEMRVKSSRVAGLMRTDFNYWHLGRIFNPASPPELNADFIKCVPDKRIFAVPSEPGLIVNIGHNIRAVRPLPIQSNPGLIDHN